MVSTLGSPVVIFCVLQPSLEREKEAALFSKLVALNARWFDFGACRSRGPAADKGSARGSVYAMTDLPLVFTLECSYDRPCDCCVIVM